MAALAAWQHWQHWQPTHWANEIGVLAAPPIHYKKIINKFIN
jgi:hypothetical protein